MRGVGALLLAVILATAGAVGCGSDDDGKDDGAKRAELTRVKIALLPVADVAPVYLGMKKGFFRAENLELEPQFAQGGAAIVPSVMANEVQFGFGNNVSLMVARGRSLPLRIVSSGVNAAPTEKEAANALLVGKKSGIDSVADLAGKTFAVTTLQQLGEVTIKATLDKHGVDTKGVKFLEVPFPDMNAALEQGRVDVAWQAEPFITIGEQQGLRSVADPMFETSPDLSIATYFGADPYLEKHPEIARAFARAMKKSLDYARANPDEARAIIPTYSQIKGKVLEKIQLANWSSELNVDSIRLTYRLARKYGVVEKDIDLDDVLPKDAA
jgi:NitT/TauT family transport system substrate-binding protein